MTTPPPNRGPVLASHGMASSEHPLVTQTGVDVMRRGGNAFDAALAMSALLPVVKPHRNHLGGDAYILAYDAKQRHVTGICSGGKAPHGATLDRYAGRMPQHGGGAAAVPGLVDAWQEFHARWCRQPLADLLAPAVSYAYDGFAVSRELEQSIRGARTLFEKYPSMARALYVGDAGPRMGQRWRQPHLAAVIEAIGREGRDAFYTGHVAQRIAEDVQANGGYMTADDLAHHRADVLDPISTEYRGLTVYETPPNSQGLILLEELNILEGFDLRAWGHLAPHSVHHQVEAKKLAFEDRLRFAGDPAVTGFDPSSIISKEWAAERRRAIDPQRAQPGRAASLSSDTTSFVVADAEGNVCSFIQSLYANWGAALAIDGTGILMNNRMTGFSLDPASPNVLAPGKRTIHTLNTYLVFGDGEPYIIGNTPGGDYQVQTNLQILTAIIDFGLDPKAAIDAPRWGHVQDTLLVEDDMPQVTQDELRRRGHEIRPVPRTTAPMGRAQVIVIDRKSGAFIGATDERGEGAAAGW